MIKPPKILSLHFTLFNALFHSPLSFLLTLSLYPTPFGSIFPLSFSLGSSFSMNAVVGVFIYLFYLMFFVLIVLLSAFFDQVLIGEAVFSVDEFGEFLLLNLISA